MTPPADAVSPLLEEHTILGATITDFAGWRMPLKYNSELAEHRAVRSAAGLFDLCHMGEIEVVGPDAGAFLDYALVSELSGIASGRAKYTLLCNAGGGVVDDLVVYRLAEGHFFIVANAANTRFVFDELSTRAAGFDATITDRSTDTSLIAVQGPLAQDIVTALVPTDQAQLVSDIKYYAVAPAEVAGRQVLLARTGYTGEDGFELYAPSAEAVPLWRALLDVTVAHGGMPTGLASRDTLRLEAGMALYGHELTRETNPYETGLGKIVHLDKDFVGRDALSRFAERPPRRRLVGLIGPGRRAARAGYVVHDAAGDLPVGVVTSGALSPTLGHPIALAFVDMATHAPGTAVTVDIRGNRERFTVTPAPFYRRPR